MAQVDLQAVRKRFGAVEVLRGVDCTIADGEFVGVVGPSGCGKTTLLRLVAGLEELSSGDIRIGGTVVNGLMPRDRNIAMVFQNYALYPHKTVYENLAYSLRRRRTPRTMVDERVRWAANLLQIDGLLERRPSQLSGGQRQRVAMGRAIVREPSVFLFDEPLSNLDAHLRTRMRVELKRLHNALGVTSIYVTHDQTEAMTLADRLIVLRGGNVEQIGPPERLYEKPASRFVASFIGSPAM
jgi:ABC-type sugar transport system ATPase subunit